MEQTITGDRAIDSSLRDALEVIQRESDSTLMLVRHESNDRHADVIGRSVLSENFDFKLRSIDWTDHPPST